ncbi:hypothetical protein [Lysinibacillus xylanilyticus]|nr:hypothetical protein [Lysinibacillus xylanilyticus]
MIKQIRKYPRKESEYPRYAMKYPRKEREYPYFAHKYRGIL